MAESTISERKEFKNVSTYLEGFHDDLCASKMIYSSFGKTQLDVSLLGFGGAELRDLYCTPKEEEGIETVIKAIKSGINYIDTAPFYGQGKAELVLGKALKQIPRSTFYLATKVGRYGQDSDRFDFSSKRTLKSVEESFHRLGVNHIDLLQVHDVEFAQDINIIIDETLPTLQSLKAAGKISHIGITGYSLSRLKDILEKSKVEIDTVLSYCRCTLFDDSLRSYLSYFKEKNLGVINAALLGMGLLTESGTPDWHPAGSEIKEICKKAANYCKEQTVNVSKLAACYSFSQPDIHVHLIGMESKKLLDANLSSLFDGLSAQEQGVMEVVIEKFYKKLPETHWENKEPRAYWEELKKLRL